VYVEPAFLRPARSELVSRLQARGFQGPAESLVLAPDQHSVAHDWVILVFSRR